MRPQGSEFLTLETGDVMTKAEMWRNCGLVTIVGDVNKLKRLTSDPDAQDRAFPKTARGDADRYPKAAERIVGSS